MRQALTATLAILLVSATTATTDARAGVGPVVVEQAVVITAVAPTTNPKRVRADVKLFSAMFFEAPFGRVSARCVSRQLCRTWWRQKDDDAGPNRCVQMWRVTRWRYFSNGPVCRSALLPRLPFGEGARGLDTRGSRHRWVR